MLWLLSVPIFWKPSGGSLSEGPPGVDIGSPLRACRIRSLCRIEGGPPPPGVPPSGVAGAIMPPESRPVDLGLWSVYGCFFAWGLSFDGGTFAKSTLLSKPLAPPPVVNYFCCF